jgi:hypothetical protein
MPAGPAPTGLSFMEWLHRSGGTYDTTAVWEDWEAWFDCCSNPYALAPIVPSYHPFTADKAGWLSPRQF